MTVARRALTRMLVDRCEIWSASFPHMGTVDPVTLLVTPPAQEILWSGPCLLQTDASSLEQTTGGGMVRVSESVLKVPADADGFEVGDVVRFPSGDPTGDEFEITRVPVRSNALTVRLGLRRREQVPGPGAPA